MVVAIIKIEPVTYDVKRFVVEKPRGYKYTPGQATDVSINQPGWKDKKKPFTFTSLNSDKHLEFTIKGYPTDKYPDHDGVTQHLHSLKPKDELIIGEPWGTIEYKGEGVFIAGGAGITPFIAIFKQLIKDGKMKGNSLFFSNKTERDVILEDKLKKWFGDNLVLTLTRQKKRGYDYGRIDKSFLKENIDNFNQNFYVCGPKSLVKDINTTLEKLGASTDLLVFEK